MAMQTQKSNLLAKLGSRARAIAEENKSKEVEVNIGLPAGIDNGVAQLVECKFGVVPAGKKNPGATFFMAQGVVKSPMDHNGVRVQGQRTMIYKEIADAKGVLNEKNFAWAQDQLKLLAGRGVDPSLFSLDNMEATAERLKRAKPHFAFRTWKGDKQEVKQWEGKWHLCNVNADGSVKSTVTGKGPYASQEMGAKANPYAGREPMVNHQWAGLIEGYTEPSANGQAVIDSTPDDVPSPADYPKEEAAEPFNEFQEGEGAAVEGSLDDLVAAADEDEGARAKLQAMAVEAGIDEDTVLNADSWAAVAEMIRNASGAGTEEAEDNAAELEEPWAPAKGEVYYYSVKDPKTKKTTKTEVEVLSVNAKAQTVTAKNLDTQKPLTDPKTKKTRDIPWDDLAGE